MSVKLVAMAAEETIVSRNQFFEPCMLFPDVSATQYDILNHNANQKVIDIAQLFSDTQPYGSAFLYQTVRYYFKALLQGFVFSLYS